MLTAGMLANSPRESDSYSSVNMPDSVTLVGCELWDLGCGLCALIDC